MNGGAHFRASRTFGRVCLWLAAITVCLAAGIGQAGAEDATPGRGRSAPKRLPVAQPEQVTFEADPVLYADVSPDGRWLACVVERDGLKELWLRSADASRVVLPRRLAFGPGNRFAPAFAPDGGRIAYASDEYDAKGDIFVLDLKNPEARPLRLTDRGTEDGAPAFSPDGRFVYFHTRAPGETVFRVARLELAAGENQKPVALDLGRDAAFPSLSPDGRRIAFVSFRDNPGGDIWVADLAGGRASPLTRGQGRDLYPRWSRDGAFLYFTRIPANVGEGPLSLGVQVFRVKTGGQGQAWPVTSAGSTALQPVPAGDRVFFLSARAGAGNVFALPASGEVPRLATAEEQIALAAELSGMVPADPLLAVLAWFRVLEEFPGRADAKAAYAAGQLYERLLLPAEARQVYAMAKDATLKSEFAGFARLRIAVLDGRAACEAARKGPARKKALSSASQAVAQAAKAWPDPAVQAKSRIEQARLLQAYGQEAKAVQDAIGLLDKVLAEQGLPRELSAEVLFLRAELFARIGKGQALFPLYAKVLERFPDVEQWADLAIARILDEAAPPRERPGLDEQIQVLTAVADKYRQGLPRLSAGAQNHIGDLLFAADEWARAKDAFRQVLERYPNLGTQTAAARLALAEILYREERFHQAIELYESEMYGRPPEDHLYRLARAAYLRKSLAAGEFLYRIGEIPAARNLFAGLLRDDPSLVAAHRGFIKCAAAGRQLGPTLADYRKRLAAGPGDPVLLYATGLCLTYVEGKDALLEGRKLIERAVGLRGQVEYFHQTLGYVNEVLETVHGQPGGLEAALESYRKAQFLNAQGGDPENAPNLLLNVGNVSLLLGQYGRAFDAYAQRLASRAPFDNPDTELLFFRRLGEAAFQVREAERTIEAYGKALALIEERLDPKRASEAFGRVNGFIKDRVLAQALREPERKALAEKLALRQAECNARVFEATARPFGPPPDPAFEAYAKALGALVGEQEALIRDLSPLIGKDRDETVQTLLLMCNKVREALRNPRQLAEMRAETLDRLGLALQEAGRFSEARDAFERALAQNERLGLVRNLAVNQRSAALSTYELAGARTGKEREGLLAQAAEGFRKAMEFARRNGVPERTAAGKGQGGGALVNLSFAVALDQTSATQALHGFSREQEIRLCEAYIARIETELGRVGPARQSLEPQLAGTARAKSVADRDAYGVGLLFHRAGLLDAALRRPAEAFDLFRRSAELALRLKNPASAAANVENMVAVLLSLKPGDPLRGTLLPALTALDRRVAEFIDRSTGVLDFALAPAYHNALGVLSFVLAAESAQGDAETRRVFGLARAATRFNQALGHLEKTQATDERRILALWSGVLLNLGEALAALRDDDQAAKARESALALARQGLLPQLAWRALAALRRPVEALAVLESTPLFGWGCAPGEIVGNLSGAVGPGLPGSKDWNREAAFNMAERLSELERVQRMAPLALEPVPPAQRETLKRAYPRLLSLDDLRRRLAKAGPKERPYLEDRLKTENQLLEKDLGPDLIGGPSVVRLVAAREGREKLLVLLGLAVHLEDVAEEAVSLSGKAGAGGDKPLRALYADLLAMHKAAQGALPVPGEGPAGVLGIFAPRPVELVEAQEALPKGTALRRIVALPDGSLTVFAVRGDGLQAEVIPPGGRPMPVDAPRVIAACEDTARARGFGEGPLALSATHLVRTLANKKPFKRSLFEAGVAIPAPPAFALSTLSANATAAELLDALADAHTLALGGQTGVFPTAPTRPGERARNILVADLPFGRLPLVELAGSLANVSLAAFSGAGPDEAFLLGHLAALFGVPTVLVPDTRGAGEAPLGRFLASYARTSAEEALDAACGASKNCLAGLGFWGLNPDEAKALATAQFARSVRAGVAAHKEGSYRQALSLFENALLVAGEDKSLARHLPDLLAYARESAFGAGRYDRAAVHAAALAELLARTRPDTPDLASALLKLGLVLARDQRFDKALPALEQALGILAKLNLPRQEIAALADLGVVLENAIRYEQALARFESAAALSGRLGMRELLAQQHMNIGRILDLRLSQYARAKQSYRQGLEIFEALGRKGDMAQAMLDMGRCARLLGDFGQADEFYRKALGLLGKDPANARLAAKVVVEQANNAWYQARYQEAFDLQRKVYQQARERGWALEQEIALNTSGLVWWTLGDHERSLRELDRALAVAKTIPARRDEVATTLNNTGLVQRDMGRLGEALETLDKALAIDRELRSRWAIAHDLRNKALTFVRMNEPRKSVPLFEEALALASGTGDKVNEAKILLGLGEALAALGRDREAAERFAAALSLSRSMALRETEWRALFGQARGLLTSGRREEARAILSQAISVIEGMRVELKMDQLKDGFIADKASVYEALVGLLADMGRTAEAFEVAERSRARNLIDLLVNRGKAAKATPDRAFIERQNTLRSRIREQEALLAQAATEAERAAYSKALKAVQDEHKDLLLEVQARNPELASLVSVSPLDLPGVQALLDKDQALLAYYVLENEVLCWLVRRDSVRLLRTPIGREGLGRMILAYRRMLQNLEPLDRQSRELWDVLLAKPVAAMGAVRSVCIVPHGPLHYLSFATLSDGAAALIEKAPLYYAPSASVLKFTQERRKAVKNRRVLAVGNPDLGNQALELPFAEREVAAMAWNFPEVTALTRGKATESWVRAHIGEYGIIHLATHGEFDAVNPLFSALMLAKDRQFDGHLEAGDIFDLKLNADLVVLSACQTGLGKIGSGDDVVGMNRAFLFAGTHAIVSSLWRVSDISTAILMKQFYREYAKLNKAESLRRAMLHVKGRYPHPGYWGGFILVGDFQ